MPEKVYNFMMSRFDDDTSTKDEESKDELSTPVLIICIAASICLGILISYLILL